jgi:peptide chain release factor 2
VRLVARGGEVAVGVIEEEIGDLRSETDADADADASAKAQSLLRSPQSAPAGLSSPKEMRAELDKLQTRIARMFEQHDLASLREQVRAMLDRIGDPDFWRDAQSAAAQIELMNALSQRVDQAENVQRLWEHCDGLVRGMATAAQARRGIINKGTLVEANQIFRELARELPLVETMLHLRDEQDQASAFVVVRSAGMDSAASASATAMSVTMAMAVDWMHDLAKMYAAWAQSRGFGVAVLNEGAHEMTLNIAGYGVYALLKGEAGLHRLVRTASAPRGRDKGPERVSVFARVDVLSDLPASAPHDFKVESKPIRGTGVLVDKLTRLCTLSFGANKDRPAVQWRNALPADELDAQARRYAAALVRLAQAQSAKASANAGEPVPNGAGAGEDGLVEIADQVRVFAMHKQQSVRDLRTKRTSTQPKKVLAGALDEFLLAYLEMMG